MRETPVAKTIDPVALKRRLDEGNITLIDIREPDEHAREHIPGARSLPLARIGAAGMPAGAVAFCCRSGARTGLNAGRLAAACPGEVLVLEGGLDAWKRAGLPVARDARAPLELMRQVQIAVGIMILAGVLLALLVSPWFMLVPAGAGAGLLVAGATGFCGMARMLALMPWNRSARRLAAA